MNAVLVWLLGVGTPVLGLALFIVLAGTCELGFRLGRRRGSRADTTTADNTVTATLTSGMVGLLAFILGLTINFAQSRFEARRDLVVTEANAIDTAWRRAWLVGGADGEAIADGVRQYAQTRLDFTRARPGGAVDDLNSRTNDEADAIWRLAGEMARKAPTPITSTLIVALNEMFDSAEAQRFAFVGEPPPAMLDMMVLGSIIAIGAMGYEMGLRGARQKVLAALLLLMWTGGILISVDLGRPRLGATRVDARPLEWTIQDIDHARMAATRLATSPSP